AVPGGGKAGVGGGGQFVGAQSLLVDPVHIKIAVKGDQVGIAVVKAVGGVPHGPGGGLLVDLGVDQVVAGGGKPHRFNDRLRFGLRLGLGGQAGDRGRRF